MKTMIGFGLMFLIMFGWNSSVLATKYIITSTKADSLAQAIIDADSHAGADTIVFNIPKSDPNYNDSIGIWTIKPADLAFIIEGDSTVIDGTSQTVNQGDMNSFGPEIEIDGSESNTDGFTIRGSANKIKGLIINRFPFYGVVIERDNAKGNVIVGNFIGTDFTGSLPLGNLYGGIYIRDGSSNNLIGGIIPEDRNIISGASHEGNINHGNGITINNADDNKIYGNLIGTNRDGTGIIGNLKAGICIRYSTNNIIGGTKSGEGNIISGNGWCGICIRSSDCMNNTVAGNYIGTDTSGLTNLGNATVFHRWNGGVILDFGARNNFIGPGNIIAFNAEVGVRVRHDSTTGNTISQNSITQHTEFGIFLEQGGNSALAPPVINEFTTTYVAGNTYPDCVVEIFSDSTDGATVYEGTVNSDDAGNWMWVGTASGPNITATVTDTAGNTSQISVPFTTNVDFSRGFEIPENDYLSQNYPNPFISKTTISFYLPKPSQVTLKVYDELGRVVTNLASGDFPPGHHKLTWDATGYPAGIYIYHLEAGTYSEKKKLILQK